MRRTTSLLAALALLAATNAAAATRVRTAYYLEPGLCEQRADGSFAGVVVDYLATLAKLNDWEIEPVFCSYDEALVRLARNEIDLVGGVTSTPARRKAFSFPSYSTGDYRHTLYVHPESTHDPNDLKTWDGIEIGLGQDDQAQRMLENYLKVNNVAYRLRPYTNGVAAARAFRQGQVEAVYTLGTAEFHSAKALAAFPSQPTYFCVPNARPDLLAQLENGIVRMQSEQPDLGLRIRNRYFPLPVHADPEFTPSERAWLAARRASGKPIVVDLTPTVLPFKGWDEKEDCPIGFVYNVLSDVGRRTGLTFTFIRPDDEASARARFLHRKVDFWAPLGVPVDNLPGYAGGITLSALPHIRLTRHGRRPPDLAHARFGVPSWDTQWQNDYRSGGATNLLPYRLLRDALGDLLDDRIDAVTVSLPRAITVCQNLNIVNRVDFSRPDVRLPYIQRVTLVPTADVDARLVSIISKCLDALSPSDVSALTYYAVTESLTPALLSDEQWLVLVSILSLIALATLSAAFFVFHRRLSRALVLARAGERARTQFLATMSHEIRTPLNAVIGFSEFLQQPDLSPTEARNYAQGVARSAHVLLDLVNDVLDISKLEAGKVDMRQGIADFSLLEREFLTIFAARIRQQGLKFVFDLPKDFPRLRLSPQHLRQLLLNLIGNAVKFTEKGAVTCTIRLHPGADPTRGDLEIAVADTGIGIAPDQLEAIFNPFVQDISTRGGRVYEGTGLGLPIVKRLVESAGGTVSVKSKPGEGATFVLRIPRVERLSSAEAKAVETPDGSLALPQSVLLVDDVPLNLTVLKTHLSRLGLAKIRTASSGPDALTRFNEAPADLVLTDLWMPEMNGAELACRLRALPSFAGRIVAVTADVHSDETFDATVFDAVITKPVTREKLRTVLTAARAPSNGSIPPPPIGVCHGFRG